MSARIPLRARDGSVRAWAIVDEEDLKRVSAVKWSLRRSGKYLYVAGRVNGRMEYLHRFVLGLVPGDGLEADHQNRNTLDCRRANLRVGTRALNLQNQAARVGAVSGFRGVSWFAQRQLWRARCGSVTIGYAREEIDAAVLAEQWRKEHAPFALPDPLLAEALAA